MRINQFLARAGVGSRRGVEKFIVDGEVTVNGETVTDLAYTVDTDEDEVFFRKRRVKLPASLTYIAFYKPAQVLCTKSDPEGRPTLFAFLPPELQNFGYAGRLDFLSKGLVLLSNDGDFLRSITLPESGIIKIYRVTLKNPIDPASFPELKKKMIKGVFDKGQVLKVRDLENPHPNTLVFSLDEGKNLHIRRMCGHFRLPVKDLVRTQIGRLELASLRLKPGQFRAISPGSVF